MKNTSLKILVLFLLSGSLCYSQTPDQLYRKAQTLYNQLPDKTPSIRNIPKYKEISDLLEEAINKNPDNKELLKKTYPLLIISYDHQARYPEKHHTMKQYAQTLYPQDKEQQAEYLKQQADKLKNEGELAETISIFNFLMNKYPDTKYISVFYLQLGKIFEEEKDWMNALKYYQSALNSNLEDRMVQRILFKQGVLYLEIKDNQKAVETFQTFISKYPESNDIEEVLYYLGRAYFNKKDKEKSKEIFEKYLRKYPDGKYSQEINLYLKLP